MLKRFLSLNLALALVIALIPFTAITAYAFSDEGYGIFSPNYDGGEEITQTIKYFSSNASMMLYMTMPIFERDGFVMTGYNSAPDGSGDAYSYSQPLRYIFSTDRTNPPKMYAQWKETIGNHILYIGGGGKTTDGKEYIVEDNVGSTATLQDENAFIDGSKKVIAWSTETNVWYRTAYAPGDVISVDRDLTLYAIMGFNAITFHWLDYKGDVISYTNYYTNSERIGFREVNEGDVLPGEKVFIGWNEKEDGSGQWYAPSDSVIGAPSNLYAQYADIPNSDYYVLQAKNGLSNGQVRMVCTFDNASDKVTLPKELKEGVAAYWYIDTYSADKYYPSGIETVIPSGTILTAQSNVAGGYCVIVDGKGGYTRDNSPYFGFTCYEIPTSPGDLLLYSLSGNDLGGFTKDGSILIGYQCDASGDMFSFNDALGDVIKTKADHYGVIGFSAIYEEVTGNYIQYVGNGAVTAEGAESFVQDNLDFSSTATTVTASNQFVSVGNRKFLGWNTQPNGSGDWYDPGEPIAFNANTVLYAQWGGSRIVYHYNHNNSNPSFGHISEMHSVSLEVTNGIKPPSYTFSSHYDELFAGWCSTQDGSGEYYTGNTMIPIPEEYPVVHVYAQWERIPDSGYYYILTANALADGRLVDVIPMASESESIVLPLFSKEDTHLFGWCDITNGYWSEPKAKGFWEELAVQQNIVEPGSTMTVTSQMLITGITDKSGIFIEYDGNGATTATGETSRMKAWLATSMAELSLYSPEDVFENLPVDKEFVGWNTKLDGSGQSYQVNTYFTQGYRKVYAQWKDTEYLVIDGVKYDATRDQSGDGWKYYCHDSCGEGQLPDLQLINYTGGPIICSRSLRIDSYGTNTITGTNGTGIYVAGDLYVSSVFTSNYGQGKLVVTGADGHSAVEVEGKLNSQSDFTAVGGGVAALRAEEITCSPFWAIRICTGETAEEEITTTDYVRYWDLGDFYKGENYIHIERLPYILTLNGNGGTTSEGAETYRIVFTTGTPGNLALYHGDDIFSNGGRSLAGWSESPDGSGGIFAVDGEYWFPDDSLEAYLYAIWEDDYIPIVPDIIPATPSTTTSTTKNKDGSTTVTTTNSLTGVVTKVTTYPNGTKVTTVEDAAGNITSQVDVSGGAISTIAIPADEVTPGTVVTITVAPDEGYELGSLVVTDDEGSAVAVTANADGTYSFAMPASRVTISVAFVEAEDESAVSDGWVSPYNDVVSGAWYYEAVAYVTANGLMQGTSDATFAPDTTTNRAMIWTVLARMNGQDVEGGDPWYARAQSWAMQANISDGTNPLGTITREELATMLYRATGSPAVSGNLLAYPDGNTVSSWAENAMLWATQNGIIGGIDGMLVPHGPATRAQVATMLMRYCRSI